MPREIDEDVDLITADDLSRLLRRKVREIAVVFDGCLYLFRIDILRIQRIDGHLVSRRVERRHQGIRKGEHNVLPHIRGEIADAQTPARTVLGMAELVYLRKERSVRLCRCPVLGKRRREIVPVKEHIARIERLERKVGSGIARPLIKFHRLRGTAKEACTLPREIIYLLRDLRRRGRIDQRLEHLQRRASRALQEIYARA